MGCAVFNTTAFHDKFSFVANAAAVGKKIICDISLTFMDFSAGQSETTGQRRRSVDGYPTASSCGAAANLGARIHCEPASRTDQYTASRGSSAADDAASLHNELACFLCRIIINNAYTASTFGLTADNAAAVHGECSTRGDIHTAALGVIDARRHSRATGDNAAVDKFRAAGFVQHPQTVTVRGEVVLCGCVAIRNRQTAA